MAIDFKSSASQRTYSDRVVDDDWKAWCVQQLAPTGKDVVDIGCGGGIYARGFAALGAASVVGVDFSERYVREAQRSSAGVANIRFDVGTTDQTRLPDECADIVFNRAVIHHLSEEMQALAAFEMYRVLRAGGVCVVQDRTVEDVVSSNPRHWIRATLFECFPRLLDVERRRRPSTKRYGETLRGAGFAKIDVLSYPETRKVHASFDALAADIMARKGKSILFELSDAELRQYCDALAKKSATAPIAESDAWTIWLASKACPR